MFNDCGHRQTLRGLRFMAKGARLKAHSEIQKQSLGFVELPEPVTARAIPLSDELTLHKTVNRFYFLKNFFRPRPARPIRPVPNSSMVAGSGTNSSVMPLL